MVKTDRKDFILDAAETLFQRFGYRRTIVEDIAREVGIAKGSIYLHFKTKEQILLALFNRDAERFDKRLQSEIKLESGASEQLQQLVLLMTSMADDYPILAQLLLGHNSLELPPELQHQCCKDKKLMSTHIPVILQRGIDNGEFRQDLDIQAVVPIIISFFHIHFHNQTHHWVDVEPRAFLESMLRIIFRGILNTERTPV